MDSETSTDREMTQEEKTKDIRVKIDALVQYAKQQRDDTRPEFSAGKRELSLAVTKLEEAKMWCGKVFEDMGRELPKQYADKAE
jgi:hypothetical protein